MTAGSWALDALHFDTTLGWAPSGRKMEDELTLVDKVTSSGESCLSEDRKAGDICGALPSRAREEHFRGRSQRRGRHWEKTLAGEGKSPEAGSTGVFVSVSLSISQKIYVFMYTSDLSACLPAHQKRALNCELPCSYWNPNSGPPLSHLSSHIYIWISDLCISNYVCDSAETRRGH